MLVSFVIPAHNEERLIGRTLDAMHGAAEEVVGAGNYEVIVVNDSSTDRTKEIASSFASRGTRVLDVQKRQISAVRTAGGNEARGDVIVFVDADTSINPPVLRAALKAIESGAVGGGAGVNFDGPLALWARVMAEVMVRLFRLVRLTGGCFLYCTRDAYQKVGGWDETLFAAEELVMCRQLQRLGRFVILRERVLTSGRKIRTHSFWEILKLFLRAGIFGKRMLGTREGLDLWYAERRQEKNEV